MNQDIHKVIELLMYLRDMFFQYQLTLAINVRLYAGFLKRPYQSTRGRWVLAFNR